MEVKKIKLNSGFEIPSLGLGTWKSEKGLVTQAVRHAIVECGYRHIDCALVYENEKEVGEGLNQAFKTGISRDQIFITSKLWNTFHNPKNVALGCKQSLKDLNLEYLDLYLVHWLFLLVQTNM